jgi:hypothetical protein
MEFTQLDKNIYSQRRLLRSGKSATEEKEGEIDRIVII